MTDQRTHVKQRSRITTNLDFHAQCLAAISAHGEWKVYLRRAVQNNGKGLDVQQVALDNQCVFGKWLYSETGILYSNDRNYSIVKALHADFHREAGRVVELCKNHEPHKALDAISENSYYSQISKNLSAAVQEWLREKNFLESTEGPDSAELQEKRPWGMLLRYSFVGFLSGFGLLLAAFAIIKFHSGWNLSFSNIHHAFAVYPLLYIIVLSPMILAVSGYVIGKYVAKTRFFTKSLHILVENRTRQLFKEKEGLSRLFENLSDGVFFIRANHTIGAQYSHALEEIFENTELQDRPLSVIFAGRIEIGLAKDIDSYLDLLFDKTFSEAMLSELNPLNPLRIHGTEGHSEKIIQIRFKRILDAEGEIEGLLCIATDITREHELSVKLEAEQEAKRHQMEMLQEIFDIGPQMLMVFKEQTETELDMLTDVLRRDIHGDLKEKVELFFRAIHSVKGAAALLGLKHIATLAHRYEDRLAQLQAKSTMEKIDFLSLSVFHGNLIEALKEMESLLDKIKGFQLSAKEKIEDEISLTEELTARLVQSAAEKENKQVHIQFKNFNRENLPKEIAADLRKILVQLVRNSVVHGIETSKERQSLAKNEKGLISIEAKKRKTGFRISYRDDGSGFKPQRIREKIIEKNLLTREEVNMLSDKEVVKYIFHSNFSTASKTSLLAGRGMGMGIVAQKVHEWGGKIYLRWKEGKYVHFLFKIPKTISSRRILD
ncbi:MAG: hypothetical protein LDLANPLL_00999 [Turneriella sp.]|nr:hypothetical protein [Turneriella sp.]